MSLQQITLIVSLLQQMCVYVVIVYLLSKTPLFQLLTQVTIRLPNKILCYLIFSAFCIMGTYFGLRIDNSIANTRATGAVLGGIVGGPMVGFMVGLTGGIHRYSLGGFTSFACMVSTIAEGVLGGLVHRYYLRQRRPEQLFNPWIVFSTALVAECLQMGIILLLARPFDQAWHLVQNIALPMMLANSFGAAILMQMLLDRRAMYEKYSVAFSARALKIAERSMGILNKGFNQENCSQLARILLEETNVGAVALTDREKLLAFIGIGEDHHLPGSPITSSHTLRAIANNEVVYADGNLIRYHCTLDPRCKLGSTLVIPLRGEDNQVIGTIKLYEPKRKLFSSLNRTLGEGVARLLSTQILAGKYSAQSELLARSEIKLLHAQVNPHFLFNALNTLASVIRTDPEKARQLVQHLSLFFRKNLRREAEEVTLKEELEHVNSYLQIELARFPDRLKVNLEIDESLLQQKLPAFSLQPIVENAIKHGISHAMDGGTVSIKGQPYADHWQLLVEDDAGLFDAPAQPEKSESSNGLGMNLVDRRIKAHYGEQYGVQVKCQPEVLTQVIIELPFSEVQPCCA
ncbi:sensor histidine kinase [Tolumonas osonensis]|uniref:Two-component system LytT family sensor kinase n=1 Tax=Tolumonas osonensis TaxID=675874 RepID=A0A841GQ82_9GAMM|nr:sensor histidine kinase [Tolumonas osonensis]MBB6055733.1 two-component system LytT family sensor kinase [Tolumonas osonensis]